MKKSKMKIFISSLLTVVLMFSAVGCTGVSGQGGSQPAANVQAEDVPAGVADFAAHLFQESLNESGNTLISPFSVLCALAMTANGAKGETLAQMEQTMGLSVEQCNEAMQYYFKQLKDSDTCQLHLANAIWFNDDEGFQVNQDFLNKNAEIYQAEVHKEAFSNQTAEAINAWVEEKTEGKIQDILDQVPEEAVMYLVNALSFDAEWDEIYKEDQIGEGIFTQADGTEQKADFMYSEESQYIEDENTVGFIKNYADDRYAFVALLPDEGISLKTYVSSLTGEKLRQLLGQPQSGMVQAAIPKFKSEYDVEMSEILQKMGMTNAFDRKLADFSDLGTSPDGNIYIDRVLHKTFISVDERGTEAGAATVVEMVKEMAFEVPDQTVLLDRPFVYLIMDQENQIPLFMGTVNQI